VPVARGNVDVGISALPGVRSEFLHYGRGSDGRRWRRPSLRPEATDKNETFMSSRITIVLVHGAFANAGCWNKLIPILVLVGAKGFSVTASNCPLSTLADDVDTVRQTIKMQDGPVLLVGHSWGGAVITEAGNDPKSVVLSISRPPRRIRANHSTIGGKTIPPRPAPPKSSHTGNSALF
jgi:pimeloyl-ACP methyl ester carboxylesterase